MLLNRDVSRERYSSTLKEEIRAFLRNVGNNKPATQCKNPKYHLKTQQQANLQLLEMTFVANGITVLEFSFMHLAFLRMCIIIVFRNLFY